MTLTNYRKFIVKRYLEIEDNITVDYYCHNICRSHIQVKDFEIWLRLYDLQSVKEEYEKKLEKARKETAEYKNQTILVKRELEITKSALKRINSNLSNCTQSLRESINRNIKTKSELKGKISELRLDLEQSQQNLKDLQERNIEPTREFQTPRDCASSFVSKSRMQLLIQKNIERIENSYNFSLSKSTLLELGINVKISNKGHSILVNLMNAFCYKTAYEAVKYFKKNKKKVEKIELSEDVERIACLEAYSIDPYCNNVEFIDGTKEWDGIE